MALMSIPSKTKEKKRLMSKMSSKMSVLIAEKKQVRGNLKLWLCVKLLNILRK
jgi:hypothetical protein